MEPDISSEMTPVQFFSLLTLTFILKVKPLSFYLICEYFVNDKTWAIITIAII